MTPSPWDKPPWDKPPAPPPELGFPDEHVRGLYRHARLSPRIGLTVYPTNGYSAQLYPLSTENKGAMLFEDYVAYVCGIASSVDPTRYPYLYDITDPLILKCLIIEALPIAEKLYANQALEIITSPRTGVV